MDTYDPDNAPDSAAWLALDEQERIQSALRHHAKRLGDALHTDGMNTMLHGSLHALVETQVASAHPSIVGETLARLQIAGLKRHAATHAIMRELAVGLGALQEGRPFDQDGYAARLAAIGPADVVAGGLPRPSGPGANRAQRRAAKKGRGGKR